jgi:phosphotriesterase-related protein
MERDTSMTGKCIHTLTGSVAANEIGLILPHEHIFVDLRGPSAPDYALADAEDVISLMKPYLEAAWSAGVTVFVECTPPGVGRNLEVLRRVAEITPMRILTPTGVYREAFTPISIRNLSPTALAKIWIQELSTGIEGTPVRAGFIKLAMSDNGPTDLEIRNLEAAAKASLATGAVIASHTSNRAIMQCELRVLEKAGLGLDRFIWVHADAEPDPSYHMEAASRGAYVEIDAIGSRPDLTAQLTYTVALIEAGFINRILLSHDAGWYEPGQPGGYPAGGIRGFTTLVDKFLPQLRNRGISEDMIHQITVVNPFQAFAF